MGALGEKNACASKLVKCELSLQPAVQQRLLFPFRCVSCHVPPVGAIRLGDWPTTGCTIEPFRPELVAKAPGIP